MLDSQKSSQNGVLRIEPMIDSFPDQPPVMKRTRMLGRSHWSVASSTAIVPIYDQRVSTCSKNWFGVPVNIESSTRDSSVG